MENSVENSDHMELSYEPLTIHSASSEETSSEDDFISSKGFVSGRQIHKQLQNQEVTDCCHVVSAKLFCEFSH